MLRINIYKKDTEWNIYSAYKLFLKYSLSEMKYIAHMNDSI